MSSFFLVEVPPSRPTSTYELRYPSIDPLICLPSHPCTLYARQEVISHCWFSNLKWENLVNKTIRPPWQPTPGNCDDGTFFDEFKSESFVIDSSEDREGDTLDVNSKLQDAWAELSAVFGEPSTLSSSQSTGAAAPSSTESV